MRRAAFLVIGNEILSGKVQDANTVELAKLLRKLGVLLVRQVSVRDEVDVIANEINALRHAHDLVFTSGGVGPTHDDVTIEAVAKAFGVRVVMNPELERMIRDHYGDKLREGHLRMALVPEGSKQEVSSEVRWPVTVIGNVYILPGVPEVFRHKLQVVAATLGQDSPFLSMAVYTKLDEATLKPWLDDIVKQHPEVDVGSYPTWSDPSYKTKLTFDGLDIDAIRRAVDAFVALLPAGEPQRIEGV